jgi:hypothetical protein
MDVRDKIIAALMDKMDVHYVRLEDDDGITGYVVSPQFRDMSTLDRQGLIENALSSSRKALTPQEQRQVLMIAGLTPEEYESVGTRIRVHKVKEMAGGTLEILLHGGRADAEYVRGALNNHKGIQTTEPKQVPGAVGILMSFRAKGNGANPLTKAKAIRILKHDRYIEVMANA